MEHWDAPEAVHKADQGTVAALTMVRDDAFFLQRWVSYYGALFGRRNLYVINHGGGRAVAEIAMGCNVMAVPLGDPHKLEMHRWRSLNGVMGMLRQWHRYVVVGDVDELIVVDPDTGMDLNGYLAQLPKGRIVTPLGLNLVHLPEEEPEEIGPAIIGPRRHVQLAPYYSKPCIVGRHTRLSRGGHYAEHRKLEMPDELYLLHLKYCDRALYAGVTDDRNAATAALGGDRRDKGSTTGGHWLAAGRDDDGTFAAFRDAPRAEGWDFDAARQLMRRTWGPRPNSDFWHAARPDDPALRRLPDRFVGLV